jgi:molybdopterin/thiamine biosynthesis adenylyltransferase
MVPSVTSNDRFVRQQELVPIDRLAPLLVTVIGVGSIGRQVARTLAAIGARRMQLVDFDHVEDTNRSTQGYLIEDVGHPKVKATAADIARLDPSIELELVEDRYRPKLEVGEAVFCCVDSIETRGAIWRTAGRRTKFWADGRMLADTIRILVAADEAGRGHYPSTLFPESEAHQGSCSARNTFDSAEIAAGLMIHQFRRWLRDMPVDADTSFNVLASELVVSCGAA